MSLHPGLSELQERSVPLAWKLEIGGLPVIYHSAPIVPTAPTATDAEGNAVAGLSYTHHGGLQAPASHKQRVNLVTGLPESTGGLKVSVMSLGRREDLSQNDPMRLLGRLGVLGADWRTDLVEGIPHQADGPSTIKIGSDPSGLTFPRLFYLGQEAIWATGHGGSGTSGDPYTLTGVKRGVLGSPVQRHVANPAKGDVTIITTDKVHWASARATVSVAAVRRTDGSLGEWVEVVHGTLASAPKIQAKGSQIAVTVVPLANKLSSKLGGADDRTYLKNGKHYFEWPAASQLWARTTLPANMIVGEVNGVSPFQNGYIRSEINAFNAHKDIFDPDVADRAVNDPRRGPINSSADKREVLWPDGYASDAPLGDRILLLSPNAEGNATPESGSDTNDAWATEEITHNATIDICTEAEGSKVVNWPGDVLALWNGASGLNPGTTQGENGQFMSIRFNLEERAYVIRANSPYIWGADVLVNMRQVGLLDEALLWYPMQPEEDELVRIDGSEFARNPAAVRSTDFRAPVSIPAAEVPTAFYQFRESHILVEDDAPADPPFDIHIDLDQLYGEGSTPELSTARVTSSVYNAEAGGYIWTLENNRFLPSFGNFAGIRPAIRPIIIIRGDDIIEVLLKVMMSGAGEGVNSAMYDVYPIGLNIPEERIDVASFLAHPRGAAVWERVIDSGVDVREVFEGILDLLGAMIVSRIDRQTGKYRLALVPASLASPGESILDIEESDTSDYDHFTFEDTINRVEYKARPPQGEAFTVTIDDVSAQAATETGAKTREIDLQGLRLGSLHAGEIESILRLAYSRKRALLAFSRRRFKVTIPVGLSYQLSLGAVVTLTHSMLAGANTGQGRGISRVPVRIVEINRRTVEGGSADVLLEYSPHNTTGWAPSLKVETVVDANTVTVEANAFTAATHPYTGESQTDLRLGDAGDYFEVDDAVIVYTEGDWANRVSTSISAIDYATRQVTFDDAHGAVVGDIVDPGLWSSATARMRGYAFLANREGLSGSEAKAYS